MRIYPNKVLRTQRATVHCINFSAENQFIEYHISNDGPSKVDVEKLEYAEYII